MTAQVVILNRYGTALASDSAVTIQSGEKLRTYNSADKITFLESRPIAVLHSGSVTIFGVPWQILLKMWGQGHGNQHFGTVAEYAADLREWIKGEPNLQTSELESSTDAYRSHLVTIRNRILNRLQDEQLTGEVIEHPNAQTVTLVDQVVDHYISDTFDRLPQPASVPDDSWLREHRESLIGLIPWAFDGIPVTPHLVERSTELLDMLWQKQIITGGRAHLAFCGYGYGAHFPSIYHADFAGIFGSGVVEYNVERSDVSIGAGAHIVPLGQTDAMVSFLTGTSFEFVSLARQAVANVTTRASEINPDSSSHFAALRAEFEDRLTTLQDEQFRSPLFNVVATLPIDEMVRLADSIVGLASLREVVRGGTSVGGPIDVALITPYAGFEWIRHKSRAT